MDKPVFVTIGAEPPEPEPAPGERAWIEAAAGAALAAEGVDWPCMVDVLLLDPDGIRGLNREHRDRDEVTDGLSFPAVDFPGGETPAPDPDSRRVFLGDVALCPRRCREQAAEYGHGYDRELMYLTVHAVLHLLGYDHMNDTDKSLMRAREEAVMQTLGLGR